MSLEIKTTIDKLTSDIQSENKKYETSILKINSLDKKITSIHNECLSGLNCVSSTFKSLHTLIQNRQNFNNNDDFDGILIDMITSYTDIFMSIIAKSHKERQLEKLIEEFKTVKMNEIETKAIKRRKQLAREVQTEKRKMNDEIYRMSSKKRRLS